MVFIHSSFRTSSTWLWKKFRDCKNTLAYYDVFHETLESLDRELISSFTTISWNSRHPDAGPYFSEYEGLLNPQGGVENYQKLMAFMDFIPLGGIRGDLSNAERDYLDGLIRHAEAQGKTPVISCARSLGRFAGIHNIWSSYHILLVRDLYTHWLSFLQHTYEGTYYFINALLSIIINSQHDGFFNDLMIECVSVQECKNGIIIGRFVNSVSFLKAFLAAHTYLYMNSYDLANLVLNVSRIAREAAERRSAEEVIRESTGIRISLADATDIPVAINIATSDIKAVSIWVDTMLQNARKWSLHCSPAAFEFSRGMIHEFLSSHLRGKADR